MGDLAKYSPTLFAAYTTTPFTRFILESLFIIFNLKNLIDFRKRMETCVDPGLSNGMSNQKIS